MVIKMKIFPAIDLYDKKAVRLFKGNYDQMTVYSENPIEIALDFERAGAEWIHMVDLQGAKDGTTPNIDIVSRVVSETSLSVEIGGGIRTMDVLDRYFNAGVARAILGTAAVTDEDFLKSAIAKYGDKVAAGADIKDGRVAIKGWVEKSEYTTDEFFRKMCELDVKTIICTDISKDGAMQGTNRKMYSELSEKYNVDIIASGGVSSLDDIYALKEMNLYGAIIGKAYYMGAIDLKEAIKITES